MAAQYKIEVKKLVFNFSIPVLFTFTVRSQMLREVLGFVSKRAEYPIRPREESI